MLELFDLEQGDSKELPDTRPLKSRQGPVKWSQIALSCAPRTHVPSLCIYGGILFPMEI